MKLGLITGYSGAKINLPMEAIKHAESCGYDSVWTSEAYGSDAITPAAWILANTTKIRVGTAIMQMPARTPAMTAMTAATLSELSGGRFLLGLGLSGPQVVEGWHGKPFSSPIGTTREYVEIVRSVLARRRLRHHGDHFRIPYDGPGATGLGKALRLTLRPGHDIPIYLASIGPRNVALTAEIADGWLPVFFSPDRAGDVFGPSLDEGFERSGDPHKAARFDIAPTVPAVVTTDVEQARWGIRPFVALYIGGMGARGRNFYFDLACRYGYEEAATTIQDLYLAGKRQQAIAAVPDALIDEVSLLGSREMIADRLEAWRASGVGTIIATVPDLTTLRTLAELVL